MGFKAFYEHKKEEDLIRKMHPSGLMLESGTWVYGPITSFSSALCKIKNWTPMTENLVVEIVKSTPPITRLIAASIFGVSFLVYTEILSPYKLTFSKMYLYRLELHRIFTSFFYFGPPNLDTMLHIIFLIRYSKMLEESFINMCDYAYFLLVVQILVFIAAMVWNLMTLGPVFSSVITYVWTRKNPNVQIQLFGCFIFPAFYLPFVLPLFSLISEKKILKNEVLGIFVGHFYYFFKFVFPKFGYDPLKTPVFFQKLFGEYEEKEDPQISKGTRESEEDNNPVLERSSTRHLGRVKTSTEESDVEKIDLVSTETPDGFIRESSQRGGREDGSQAQEKEFRAENSNAASEHELCERSISYEVENSTLRDTKENANTGESNPDSYLDLKIPNETSGRDEDESSEFEMQRSLY